MASPDEAFALKKNVVHQTRLTMELQQLEKKRNVSLRQMDKSSHVFMKRLEQMKAVRRRAADLPSVRRAESAPLTRDTFGVRTCKEDGSQEHTRDVNLPFITKPLKLEPAVSPRQLGRTKSYPATRFCNSVPEAKTIDVNFSFATASNNAKTPERANKNVGFMIRDHSKPRYPYPCQRNIPSATASGNDGLGKVRGKGILLQRRKSDSNLGERKWLRVDDL